MNTISRDCILNQMYGPYQKIAMPVDSCWELIERGVREQEKRSHVIIG
jgi:hypothetical protein